MTREQAILEVKVIRNFINIHAKAGHDVPESAWVRVTNLMNEFDIKIEEIKLDNE